MVLKLYLYSKSRISCQDVKGMVAVLHPSEKAARHILDDFYSISKCETTG